MKSTVLLSLVAAMFCMTSSVIAEESIADKDVVDAKPIEVLLLSALPASGKSEARRYLSSLNAEECLNQFGIGETVQLDDFPYVFFMRRISDELTARGEEGMFFISPALPFRNPKEWGTLIHLVNEDYEDLVAGNIPNPKSAAEWLFNRIDKARMKVGAAPELGLLPADIREELIATLEDEAASLLKNKIAEVPESLDGKTVVIEFARGGAESSTYPLPAPFGYKYSFSQLSDTILEKASILYIWVDPAESRRKNLARANPDDPGSILSHCVPQAVMYGDYGTDDIAWLLETSDVKDTVRVETDGGVYHLPLGRFDNRIDKTTFAHGPVEDWKDSDIAEIRAGLEEAFAPLTGNG
ncbi:MAG: hypothetical protein HN411_02960 [Waddliaceae bacterium]|jgi:hypothetical protein|nr:hypothetical protein [Waddliaceae bacterium]MBT3578626.1 hypothetical protein [Waddliaceae bacterium]MBT4445345.1 hypothetical protein [Waddliaceae bacterium]MBT6928387.1 hypothetical protein [Waddliaceae bacterium]MBT7265073.1 hypothetical protein [Waddliaceae bacterium]